MIRALFSLSLAAFVGASVAAAPKPARRGPVAPPAPLAAARGVARAATPATPAPSGASSRETIIPQPPPARPRVGAPARPAPPAGAPAASPSSPLPAPASDGAAPVSTRVPRPNAAVSAAGASEGGATPTPERTAPTTQQPSPPAPPPAPPLVLSVSRANVPLGENRAVTVTGSATAPEVTAEPPDVVALAVSPAAAPGVWNLTLRGLVVGETSVLVTSEEREQRLKVRVMKYAGRVTPAQVEVTGQPAPAELVLRAARQVVSEAVKLEAGAALAVGSPAANPPELPAGQAATVSFPVTLSGPDLLPVKAVAAVTVRNRDLEPREVSVLLYSNEPEQVPQTGPLFAAELTAEHPARLLFHHQNRTGQPLRLRVELINPSDQPADVQVIEGLAGPTFDPIDAGHKATARYVRAAIQGQGIITRVPANSQQTITTQRFLADNTVSGLLDLRSLGTKLFVRVVAEADAEPFVALLPAEPPAQLSDHIYPSPRRPLKARYEVGQNWAFLKLGGDPVVARDTPKKLAGNYGVSYEIALEISNPTSQPQEVAVTLSPDAGSARGVFVIDGVVVEADPVSPPVEADLATFRLQPGERRSVRVETIPVGGSSYPARVVVRPARPLRAAQAAGDEP